jgi:hypothetical protein
MSRLPDGVIGAATHDGIVARRALAREGDLIS